MPRRAFASERQDTGTHAVKGFEWFIVVAAFLGDLGAYGGTARGRD